MELAFEVDCRRGYEVPETNSLPKRQLQVVDKITESIKDNVLDNNELQVVNKKWTTEEREEIRREITEYKAMQKNKTTEPVFA